MANLKISQLAELTGPATTDILPVVDLGTNTTKKAKLSNLPISTPVQTSLNGKNPYHGVVARTVGATNPLPTHLTTTTFTLGATANTISYYYKGSLVTVDADKTCALDDGTAGLYFVYFNEDTGAILSTKNFPGIDENSEILIATSIWNGTDYGLINDERHSHTRNKKFHEWAHNTVGVRYRSGIILTHNGGTGAAATFASTGGELADEDIRFAVPASSAFPTPNACRLMWQSAAALYDFDKTPSTVPFKRGANNRPCYVRSDTYALVELNSAVNRYINCFVYATSDLHTPIYMITETVSPATATANGYTSVTKARAIPFPNLSGLNIGPEFKPIYRLIIRADGVLQAIDVNQDDYRTVSSLPMSAGISSTTAGAVSFTPYGTLTETNVQAAIEQLYDIVGAL